MNKTKVTRFLLAVILLVVVAFGVMACEDKTPDENKDETTYKIEVTCDANQGEYKLEPAKDAYKKGDEVKLTVTPKSEYELDKVTIDGKTATANSKGSYTITVGEANVKVNITFKTKGDVPPAPSTYEVTVKCDKAKATVTFDEEGPYEEGKKVTFTVSPIGDNKIKSVKFNDTELKADKDDKYTITITKDKNVIDVEFETSEEPPVKTTYTVNLEYEEAQGSVTLSPSAQDNKYEEGADVTINIEPNENYEIESVKANDSEITKADGVYKFTVSGKTTVKVTFKEKKVEPPVTDGPEGGLWTNEGTGTETDPYIIKELNGTIKFRHTAPAAKPWFKLQDFEYDTEYKIVSADPVNACYVRFYKNSSANANIINTIGVKGNDRQLATSITFTTKQLSKTDNVLFTIFNNNALQECDVTWVFEKVEKEPAPSGNLIVSGTGTQTDPYILSGMEGTATFKAAEGATQINSGVQFKVTAAAPGKYKFTSDTAMNISLYKDEYKTANLIASLTSDPTWLANPAYSDTFEITEQTVLIFRLTSNLKNKTEASFTLTKVNGTGGEPGEPSVDNKADDFVGNWKSPGTTQEPGHSLTLFLKITKTSDTEVKGELTVSGSSAPELRFVKGSDGVWKDKNGTNYTIRLNDGKLYLEEKVGSAVDTRVFEKDTEQPVQPSIDLSAYLGKWYGKYEATVEQGAEEMTLIITMDMPFGPMPLTYNEEKGYFENSSDVDLGTYVLKLNDSELIFSMGKDGGSMQELTFTRNKPAEGVLFEETYIGKYENNGVGKLYQKEYAKKTVVLEVTANAISIKLDGVAQTIQNLQLTTDEDGEKYYTFIWKELDNATLYLSETRKQLSNGYAVIGIFQSKSLATGIYFIEEGTEPTPPVEQERKIKEKYYGTYVATQNSDAFYVGFENASISITADGVEFYYNSEKQTISQIRMDEDDGVEYIYFFWDNCPWATTDANKHFYIMTLSGKAPQRAFILYESTSSMKHPLNFVEGELIVASDDEI